MVMCWFHVNSQPAQPLETDENVAQSPSHQLFSRCWLSGFRYVHHSTLLTVWTGYHQYVPSNTHRMFHVTHLTRQLELTVCWGQLCAEQNSCSSSPAWSVTEAGRRSLARRSLPVESSFQTPSCEPSTLCPEHRGNHEHSRSQSARTAAKHTTQCWDEYASHHMGKLN